MPGQENRKARFIAEYAIDLNAKAAALRAGYSARSARVVGLNLLKNPAVAAAVADNARRRLARLEVTPERVLASVAKLAFPDIRGLYRADGTHKPIAELDDQAAAGVEWIEFDDKDTRRLRGVGRVDNLASLELLMRHFGLLDEPVDDGRHPDLWQRIADARARAP